MPRKGNEELFARLQQVLGAVKVWRHLGDAVKEVGFREWKPTDVFIQDKMKRSQRLNEMQAAGVFRDKNALVQDINNVADDRLLRKAVGATAHSGRGGSCVILPFAEVKDVKNGDFLLASTTSSPQCAHLLLTMFGS